MFSKSNLLLLALLLLGTTAVYFPVRTHPAFNPDDFLYVTHNSHVQAGLTAKTFVWAFRNHSINWHPLTWLSHAADVQLFGLNLNAHHLMNVAFHVLNVFLLFWVLFRATCYAGRSYMVAALFALHPVNVEAVAWIAERKTLLSTTFFLLALGAYRWYVEKPGQSRFWAVAGFFSAALLAKAQVIAFPFLLLLWDYWPLNRFDTPQAGNGAKSPVAGTLFSLVMEKMPLFGIAAAEAVMTLTAQGVTDSTYRTYPLLVRVENAIVCYGQYVGKALWPFHLAVFYPHPTHALPLGQILGSLLLLVAISAVCLYLHDERYLVVGWCWFLGCMVPMIGIVQVGNQAMADRYMYQPLIGLLLMLCWGLPELLEHTDISPRFLPVLSTVVLLGLATLCRHQVNYWKDDLSLWSHSLAITGSNKTDEYHLANALLADGRKEEALLRYLRALEFDAQDPYVNLRIGEIEHMKGDLPDAIRYYQQVVNSPEHEPVPTRYAYLYMARAYATLGDSDRAQYCLREAQQVQVEPDAS